METAAADRTFAGTIEPLPWAQPRVAFAPLAGEPYALLLESSDAAQRKGADNRWSLICARPYGTLTARNGKVLRNGAEAAGNAFEALRAELDRSRAPAESPLPFIGGAAGYFSYDLGRLLERLPPQQPPFAVDDQHLPDMALGLYDLIAVYDHHAERAELIVRQVDGIAAADRNARAAAFRAALTAPGKLPDGPSGALAAAPVRSAFTRSVYEKAVSRVIEHILDGDIFQANLSQRFETELRADATAFDLYRRLATRSPAPFSAFFNFGEGALVSSSPERFLELRGRTVTTKPIKGTRPRGRTEPEDQELAAELMSSSKDRAENVMIVDLLRNDLSRVCAPHTIETPALCALESFANVHHLVSTVTGRLRDGADAIDLLKATFPGGSITGAPKIRAEEIIAALEPTTRGPYCGSIGYLGFDGAMDLNIAIRTAVVAGRRVTFQAGGGIVAQSDPAAEYDETLAKASAIRAALEGAA